MRVRTTIFATLLLALASPALHAQEDDSAEAKKQFIQGSKAFSAGKFAEAAQAFETAAALKPNAVALYTAALAWEQANQSERAADDYARATELPNGGLNAQQTSTAKDRLASLEKVLGTLAVTGPEGYKVQLDQFTEAPVPTRLHGTGGTHSLATRAPGKPPEKREVMLEGNQVQKLDVSPTTTVVKKDEPVVEPKKEPVVVDQKPSGSHMSVMKALGFTAIGVGGAGVLGAIMLGISAQDAGDAYNAGPSHAALVHANALATWTTGVWIGAGVCVALGITLVLIPEGGGGTPKKTDAARLRVTPTPGGLVVGGSF
jgi:hypothetical protein